MTCTPGEEVILVADEVNNRASSNVHFTAIDVEVGVCYNKIAVDIDDKLSATFIMMAVYDDEGGDIPVNLIAETVNTIVPEDGFVYHDIPEFTTTTAKMWLATQGNSGINFNSIDGAARRRDPNTFGTMPDPVVGVISQTDPIAMKIMHDGTGHGGGPGGTVKAKQQLADRPTLKSEGIANSTLKLKTILIQTGKLWFQKRLEALAILQKLQAKGIVLTKIRYETRNHAKTSLNFKTKNEAYSIAEIGCQIAYTLTELHKSVEQENKVNKLKLLAEVFQNG